MEEKQQDLIGEKRKKLLLQMVEELSAGGQDFYYQPTVEIARALKSRIDNGEGLLKDDLELLKPLSERDIQVLLSFH